MPKRSSGRTKQGRIMGEGNGDTFRNVPDMVEGAPMAEDPWM